eukprot:3128216-Pyramimonas_sp.AAC.1
MAEGLGLDAVDPRGRGPLKGICRLPDVVGRRGSANLLQIPVWERLVEVQRQHFAVAPDLLVLALQRVECGSDPRWPLRPIE